MTSEKKDIASELIKKARAPGIDLSILKKLEALRNDTIGFNKNDNNNNERLPPPPPSPLLLNNFIPPPQFSFPPPALFNSFQQPQYFPPPLSSLPSPPLSPLPLPSLRPRSTATQTQSLTNFGEMKMTKTKTKSEKEQVLEDIDTAIYEMTKIPQLDIVDPLLNFFSIDAEKSSTDDYVNAKKLQDKTLEQIKEEYNFDEIKDAFDVGKIFPQVEFFSVVKTIISCKPVIFCF